MMYNFPFYPHFSPRYYSVYPQNHQRSTKKDKNIINEKIRVNNSNHKSKKSYNMYESHANTNKLTENNIQSNNDDNIFEIFGIKLHSDDILLICLIFFLFKEGVKDEYLFISLILLLLS